jgi:1,4-dihydroxy-2-naphthoate octaprenyltransferase
LNRVGALGVLCRSITDRAGDAAGRPIKGGHMSAQKPIEQQTVKALSWQLLYGNYARKLGPDGWAKMAEQIDVPDFKHLDQDEDCPMQPFNQAVLYIDRVVGNGDGSKVREITRASVQRWASIFKNLVNQLQGRPQKMMEIFCWEVHPYFLNDGTASSIVESKPSEFTLRLDNGLLPEFKIGLVEGFVEIVGGKPAVTARADGTYHVTWEILKDTPQPSKMALFINAARLPFLTATVIPVLLGTIIAWKDGFLNLPLFLLTLVGASCFHIAHNVINDYFDFVSGADNANLTPTPFSGGSRVIQRGLMSPAGVRNLALVFYAIGAAIGLVLVALRGAEVLWIGVAGFLAGFLYTAPFFRAVHRGLGEVFVALGFGPIVVLGAYFVQTGRLSGETFVASLPIALLIAAVLYINEIPDRPWDAKAGKRTLVVRLSLPAAIRGYLLIVLAAYGAILAGVIAGVTPAATLIGLLTIPMAWTAFNTLRRNYNYPYRLIPANAATVFLHLLTGLLLFAGYVVGGLLLRSQV